MANNSIVLRTVYALNPRTGQFLSPNQMLVTDGLGGTNWIDSLSTLIIAGGPIMNELPSTISTFTTQIYLNNSYFGGLSSMSTDMYNSVSSLGRLFDSAVAGVSRNDLLSTVGGLGSIGYVSTSGVLAIISTISAEGQVNQSTMSTITSELSNLGIYNASTMAYMTQLGTMSTVNGLGSLGYISSLSLTSTITGLGSSGYVSSASLVSTVDGLGSSGYISTSSLYSTVAGLGNFYISTIPPLLTPLNTSQLYSTVAGLGSIGYVSTLDVLGSANLVSTVAGLGSANYVSTTSLVSTTKSLFETRTNVRFDNTTSVTTIGGTNSFFGPANVIYISSFLMSSVTYSGNNAAQMAGTLIPGKPLDMTFSTASINLGGFSNYIDSNSIITIDVIPHILFSKLATGATGLAVLPISSFLQYGNSNLYNTTVNSYVNIFNSRVWLNSGQYIDASNTFNTLIKLQIPRGTVKGFAQPYNLVHYMPSSLNNAQYQNALHNCNITPYFGSTGSLFVSVQNLPT